MLGAPTTITPPAGELISLDSAKTYLRVDGDEFDLEIEMIVAACTDDVQEYTGLRLLTQVVSITAESFEDLSRFRVGPIQSILSISYRDTAGRAQTVDSEHYALAGKLFDQSARPIEPWPVAEKGSIEVELAVGYGSSSADVPPSIRYAAYALLRARHEEREVDLAPLIASYRFF